MTSWAWYSVAGGVLICMALLVTLVARLPLSSALIYLVIGIALGSLGTVSLDLQSDTQLLETFTELAVVISLFTAGLKLRAPLRDAIWRVPLRLATWSMLLTIVAIAAVACLTLELPLGTSIILAAAIAPTDPVLASDVQVADPHDRDRLRFGLTGEAGLNDGAAFPFVLLGLALLGGPPSFELGVEWLLRDVLYKISAGFVVGAGLGTIVGRLVLYLRVRHREAIGSDEFLALGLLCTSYGVAVAIESYGFLAVFAAGIALRGIEARAATSRAPERLAAEAQAVDKHAAPAFLANAVLGFNEQLERISEVAMVIAIGILLANAEVPIAAVWFVPLIVLVIRPMAVALGLLGTRLTKTQRWLCAWFGVKGVGSLYYVSYAIAHGLGPEDGRDVAGLVLVVIAVSIAVHGISVTPLMTLYARWSGRR